MNTVVQESISIGQPVEAATVEQPRRSGWADFLFANATRLAAWLVLAILLGVIGSLVIGAWPALQHFGPSFLFTEMWNPVTQQFGALGPLYGTVVTSLIALVIAVPVSFGIAVFITELSPRLLRRPLGIAIELLAGIPSIIYGMWGLFVFAPWFGDNVQPWLIDNLSGLPGIGFLFEGAPLGIGMFTAGLILAIMVIPFITAVMRDVFEIVPPVLKESSYALGATTWEVVRHIVLPYTKVGVIGGIMLGLGRALGETMAVTFVIGNAHRIDPSLFMPGTTISATLANEFAESDSPMHIASLMSLGLILFLLTFTVLVLARLLLLRLKRREGVNA